MRLRWTLIGAMVSATGLGCAGLGCAGRKAGAAAPAGAVSAVAAATTEPVREGFYDPELESMVCPPAGWRLDPPKATERHVHKTWLSPTGDTAYGVIRFKLPLPVGLDLALWGFLREMRRTQGDATLLEKREDPTIPPNGGLRFVAEGGKYKVRTKMTVRGFSGWCVYAGTLRGRPEVPGELREAEAGREATRVGTGE